MKGGLAGLIRYVRGAVTKTGGVATVSPQADIEVRRRLSEANSKPEDWGAVEIVDTTIEADTATLTTSEPNEPTFTMKRIDDRWRLVFEPSF
jgi:hypothetical protein